MDDFFTALVALRWCVGMVVFLVALGLGLEWLERHTDTFMERRD